MKILKIFGFVVGVHVFALVLIFANPGCSTATKPPPVPSDTTVSASPPPTVSVPNTTAGVYTAGTEPAPVTPAPILFDPNAVASGTAGGGVNTVRFTPTRPGTPVAGTLVAEKVADVTPATTYIVKPGDSLWSIAKKHKLSVADLTVANGMAANANLQPGKKLLIPSKSVPVAAAPAAGAAAPAAAAAKPAAAPAAKAGGEAIKHTVKTGESLGSIARNYGVRQSDIAVANNISDPAKIQAGMELVIPGWQPTKGKNGKAAAKGATAPGAKTEPKVETPATNAAPPAATPPLVPIIRIDDSPITPAPKR